MFGLFTSLLPMSQRPARHALRTCPVCQTGVTEEEHYIAVRGMRIHGGCASYRTRQLGSSARAGRLAG
jgi:hypothetical protein